MTFRVGQKVVCVKRGPWGSVEWEAAPGFRGVYTIRTISPGSDGTYLRFEQIVNRPSTYAQGYGEAAFASWHFRPIVERKTDISIFTKMLTPNGVDA